MALKVRALHESTVTPFDVAAVPFKGLAASPILLVIHGVPSGWNLFEGHLDPEILDG